MRAPATLLDRDELERLERLTLRWSQSFRGLLGGANVSRFPGPGYEFLDHRQFHSGDDLRAVNWRAYLRLERLFLKMFRTEPRTPVRLLLDVSESMACGGADGSEPKLHYACRLAAAVCYIGLVRLETIVLHPFAGGLGESFRAQGGRHRFARASDFLSGLESGGPSNFYETARQLYAVSPNAGLLIVLSDFLDDTDCHGALQLLADQGHELHLIQIAAAEDRLPPWDGELELADAETGRTVKISLDREAAEEHAAGFDAYVQGIERMALRNEGRFLQLMTSQPFDTVLHGSLTAPEAAAR